MAKDMTWGQFKAWVEEHGVTDDCVIQYIDISYPTESCDFNIGFDETSEGVKEFFLT